MAARPPVLAGSPTYVPARGAASIPAASLFTASDPDGETITQYHFFDGTVGAGHFLLDGVVQPEYRNFTVNASDLANLVFVAGGSDQIWIQAYDGSVWSAWQIVTIVPPPNTKPVVTVADIQPAKSATSVGATNLFSVTDADGDAMTRYRFFDGTGGNGRFVLGGVAQSELVNIEITAAQLGSMVYQTSTTGVGDVLWVQAFDGYEWSDWKFFNAAAPRNAVPVVSVANIAPARGTASIAAAALFTVSDADGDSIARYKFFDGTIGNGRFLLSGTPQAEQVNIEVTAAQLSALAYQTSATGTGDTLWVQAFDGMAWSEWKSFAAAAPANNAPVVLVNDRTPPKGTTTLAASTLFSVTDGDGDAITRYRFFDGTIGNGRLLLGGAPQVEQINIEITAAQLAAFVYQVSVTGTGDTLWVQAYDGAAWSTWKSFAVGVPRNTAPVVSVQAVAPAAGTTSIAAASLLTVTDPDGDAIVQYRLFDETVGNGYIAIGATAQATGRNITVNAADLPNTRFVTSNTGSDVIWVQAFDGTAWSDWRFFSIAAAPAGPAITQPVAAADTARTNEDTARTISVLANDDDGGSATLGVTTVTQGAHGAVSINSDGTLRYVPVANYFGADSFSYTIANSAGSSVATVTVTIDPVNDAPNAANDTGLTTPRNTAKTITTQSLLANDSDADGDALTITGVGNAAGGTVALVGGNIVFTPTASYSGAASFVYTASDGKGGQDTATVTLTVLPNTAPLAADDRAIVSGGTVIAVMTNDSDANGDRLSVTSFTQTQHGTLTLNANDTFTYVADDGYSGEDSFTYTLSDGTAVDAASVSITVVAPPTGFRQMLTDAGQGSWTKLNINRFADVWTPAALRPWYGDPSRAIYAWSSMAWDPNRGDLIFWGGGHANSSANEVYRWRSSTLSWERASLPSDMVQIGDARYRAVDGVKNAPVSAHTYDLNEFLPVADRFVVFGGAAWNIGGFVDDDGTATGPYFWDPSKADGNKVGGTTGSAVGGSMSILGGQMWQNRDNLPTSGGFPGSFSYGLVNATTAYAKENGKDVLYISDGNLWKYTVNDVNDPSKDIYQKVGAYWGGEATGYAGAFDPTENVFVKSIAGGKFTYWDLDQAGPNNKNQIFVPTDLSGGFRFDQINMYGMDFDPVRGNYVLWNGNAEVWILTPPTTLGASGWTLRKQTVFGPDAPEQAAGTSNGGPYFTGVLGKWKYIAEQDIFLGVIDPVEGTIWAYKPGSWHPDNVLPTVALRDPAAIDLDAGESMSAAGFVTWSDADGDRVRFTFTDQTSGAGHFRLNGADQAANVALTVTDTQLRDGALQWVAGGAGSQDQIRLVAADPFGNASPLTFMSPAAMAGLLAQAVPQFASMPAAAGAGSNPLLAPGSDDPYLVYSGT